MVSHQDIIDNLTAHGIKPSVQRLAVMEYLVTHHSHPSVDEIYTALHPKMPTLSKTTVYNTLKLFTEQGAARQLTIDERNVCYDATLHEHAHFLCKHCGNVYDVAIRKPQLIEDTEVPEGFRIDQSALYLRGVCKDCLLAAETPTRQESPE